MKKSTTPASGYPRWQRHAALGGVLLLLLGLIGLLHGLGQPLASSRAYAQDAGAPAVSTPIPPEHDPDAPGLSREERFRRARMLLVMQEEVNRQIRDRRARGEVVVTPLPPPPHPMVYNDGTTRSLVKTPNKSTTQTTATLVNAARTTDSRSSGLALTDRAKPPSATLYLDPAGRTVRSGEKFSTRVRLLNEDHLAMDALHLILSYSPKNLKPVAVHQDQLVMYIEGKPRTKINSAEGTLAYDVLLKKPLDGIDIPLVTVVWEALEPADGVWISPAAENDLSAALWDGKSITASLTGVNNTLSGARVTVRPTDSGTPQGAKFIGPTLASMQPLLIGLPNQNELRKPRVWLGQPPAGTALRAGEWIPIDLGIDNPDHMAFDEIKLAGHFDPAVVELADSDKGNWIATGINLLDGPFHVDWPWDLHFVNRVSPQRGYFYYHMGMSSYREQPSGVVARLFARVKQDTTSPIIEWIFDPQANFDQATTGIFLLGENVLTRNTPLASDDLVVTSVDRLPGQMPVEKADPKLYRNQP
jgi:hypothetical protein